MHILKNEIADCKKPESFASLVQRLGTPEATTLLHSPCHVFQIPQVDGAIGYYQVGQCAVVIGDPICLPNDREELAKAFDLHCLECKFNIIYLLAYYDFTHWAIKNGYHTLIQVGSELNINPTNFQKKQKLRWKVNQALQCGVQIEEYKNFDPSLENQIKDTIYTWLDQRQGPQIHLGDINFFNKDVKKRIFYAQQKDKMIGVLMLTPVDRFQGWVVNSHLVIPKAPIGTTEHLMCSTFKTLSDENCHFLCLGAVSGTRLGEMVGLSSFGKTIAQLMFRSAKLLFKLDAKAIYFNKYHPYVRSTFLLCRNKLHISELLAIKHVLNMKL